MPIHNPSEIRNIALTGHGGCGKTILAERLLFAAGVTKRMGTIEEGNTVSDHTKEEAHHKHSLTSSVVYFTYKGRVINLIDTPGLSDFLGHAISCMPPVETVAVVIDAAHGIESTTRRLLAVAAERQIPRMIIINKIESPEADLEALVELIRDEFGSICLPINLPAQNKTAIVNVFDHDGSDDVGDAADFSSVRDAHKAILEQVVEVDEDLMALYLEQGESLKPDQVHAAFEKALGEGHLVPICFCSAKTGVGIDDLLHVLADLCPSPMEVQPPELVIRDQPDDAEHVFQPRPDPAAKVVAHVFKVTADPFVGKLAFFRVYSGTIRTKSELFLNDSRKGLRIGHLYKIRGRETIEVDALGPGDLGAVSKIDEIHFNGILHDSHDTDSVRLVPLPLPRPMFGLAIELKNHADEGKFSTATSRLADEDPCFRVERIAATKQTVVRGLGELHLRVMLERLKTNFGIDVTTAPPKVAYKETVTVKANGHHRHKKQTGGAGQFGEVYLTVEPLPPDLEEADSLENGFAFINDTVGGSIPKQFMPAIEKGVRQVLTEGAIAGYPLTGVCVRVYDGKYHAVDSKEVAFVTAGKRAFIDGVKNARPVLLEPIVDLEITAPSNHMGDITGHLSGKRGRVQSTEMIGADTCLIRAQAPLGELQTYSNELKSMTAGQGSFSMEYSHDEHTPAHIQAEVVAAYKPRHEED